jgi:amidophosphoribosyltransferase
MCGIVGLFLKDKSLELTLGEMLTQMLITMSDRGPDSAGIAIYKNPKNSFTKVTVQSSQPQIDFENIKIELDSLFNQNLEIMIIDTHAIITIETEYLNSIKEIQPHLSLT